MKPATILSESEGRRLHKLATNIVELTTVLLNGGKPKRRRRRKAKAKATSKAPAAPKAKKSTKPGTKKYPVETTTN